MLRRVGAASSGLLRVGVLAGATGFLLCAAGTRRRQRRVGAWLGSMMDQFSFGLCFMDRELRHVSVNSRIAEITGVPKERFAGRRLQEVLPEFDPLITPHAREVLATGRSIRNVDIPVGNRWYRKSFFPIFDRKARVIGIGMVTDDVTTEKEFENRLRSSIQQRDEFISAASHELKTPLTALSLQAEMALQAAMSDPERTLRLVDYMLRQIRRMKGLVDELLDVSRITAGKLHLEPESLDLSAHVEGVIAMVREERGERLPELRFRAPGPVFGIWDSMRLDQIFMNLLTNAVKYGDGKPIEVDLDSDSSEATVTIRDHGRGIIPEDQQRIFQRFERGAGCEGVQGFGLGLWIVRQIVEAHGGRVEVESRMGDGSSFRVILPRRKLLPAQRPGAA